jgi:cellobiose phosphorylase
LIIDPCIPSAWKGFSVKRIFRSITYIINVTNPSKVTNGIKCVSVDGKQISQRNGIVVLPLFDAGTTHVVEVTLG